MVLIGIICLLTGFLYYYFTKDTPSGNYSELVARGEKIPKGKKDSVGFLEAAKDYRVWVLFVVYVAWRADFCAAYSGLYLVGLSYFCRQSRRF